MTHPSFERAAKAQALLQLFPPLIRNSLLDEQSFREEYGLKVEATIAFGESGVSFHRSVLFGAIRAVLNEVCDIEIEDVKSCVWKLGSEAKKGEGPLPALTLARDEQRLVLPGFAVFSNLPEVRVRSLEEASSDVNLPPVAQDAWRAILAERPLDDDELEEFREDLRDTPVHVERAIRDELTSRESSVSSLIPNSRRYFERLVGAYDGSSGIGEYSSEVGQELFKQLTGWRPFEGFLLCLLLSSHSALSMQIDVSQLNEEELLKAYDFIEKSGDMFSRVGALEVGMRVLPERPEIEPYLPRLFQLISRDDVESNASEFKLLSALFVFVDGELSRTRLFGNEPPYYRRLASLAHAALIHRQFLQCGLDAERFSEWAFSSRGEAFYMQSLVDMRTAPRWNPELSAASQLKQDCFGRIMICGNAFEDNIGVSPLGESIYGDSAPSMVALGEFPRPLYPGPLEGGEDSPSPLPDDLANAIEEQLSSDVVEASSFVTLVNSAMIFRVTSGHAELAAKALQLANNRLANLEQKSQLTGILNGLATVAAVSRNTALADELRILVRRYRRDPQFGFSIGDAMRMCLVASAACESIQEWRELAGDWLNEFAFSDLAGDEGEVFYSHLVVLLDCAPELWPTCARAHAALQAWCMR